jgi:DNA-binding NtrC family response regulator/tetratricopeptide (TPR) repeat protein
MLARMAAFAELLGESPEIRGVRDQLERLISNAGAKGRLPPLLILGPTGSGKGLLAKCLHRASPRAPGPFVSVNCAAIPSELIESELFGHLRGAFTGAIANKQGLFETAHQGTLFLDEIGALPLSVQAKLLTALEDRTVRRVGSTTDHRVDIWILAATNEKLDQPEIRHGRFRDDLYHRLSAVIVRLPSLSQRAGDIRMLAEHFLRKACAEYELPSKQLTADGYAALERYPFPGNVRELANLMERAALLVPGVHVAGEALNLPPVEPDRVTLAPQRESATVREEVDEFERRRIEAALKASEDNLSRAAAQLRIPRNTLRYRMSRLGILRDGGAGPTASRSHPERRQPALPGPARDPGKWERQSITFLRLDVAARPEAVGAAPKTDTLNLVLNLVMDKVRSFGGLVDELGPDYVIAIFGVETVEDGPARAANVVVAVRAAARRAAPDDVEVSLRAAIHVRHCLVDAKGDEVLVDAERRDATAVLRSLVEDAPPDGALVSAVAQPHLARRFALGEPRAADGAAPIIGRAPVRVAARGTIPTPFVGRDRELATLRSVYAEVAAGEGRVVSITGEPGSGKTRLLYEFRRGLRSDHGQTVRVAEGACASHGTSTPYGAVAALLRDLFGVDDTDGPEVIAERIRRTTSPLEGYWATHGADLHQLLGASAGDREAGAAPPDPRPANDSPEARRAYTFEAVKQLWRRLGENGPTVLVMEDLHWVDPTTRALLVSFIEELAATRVMLLTTSRDPSAMPWARSATARLLALGALTTRASVGVVQVVLGTERADAGVTQLIVERGGGNPLFLEELALMVRDQGPGAVGGVPATTEGILRARIDGLPAGERRLLQVAAVIGREVPHGLLSALADQAPERTVRQLASLQAADFLHPTNLGAEALYVFKHALTRDVAYESLLPEIQRTLHARVVTCLAAEPGALTERLADHAVRAGSWELAVGYLREAGERAFARSANREALAWFQQGVQVMERLPPSPENLRTGIDLRFAIRSASFLLGALETLGSHLDQAADLATRLGDERRLGMAWAYLTHYCWLTGLRNEELRRHSERARQAGALSTDRLVRLTANQYVGLTHMTWGNYREAEALLRAGVRIAHESDPYARSGQAGYPAITLRGYLVLCLAELGGFDEGIACGEKGLSLAKQVNHEYSFGIVAWDLAYLWCLRGDVDAAIGLLHRCAEVHDLDRLASGRTVEDPVESARRTNYVLSSPRLLWLLGHAYSLAGRPSQGIELIEEALAASTSCGMRVYDALTLVHLGEAYLRAGRIDEARAAGQRALALAESREQEGFRAYALRLLGDVWAHPDGDAARAEECYRVALPLAETHGMRPLEARCHAGLGSLTPRTDGPARDAHRARATVLLRELGMRLPSSTVVA